MSSLGMLVAAGKSDSRNSAGYLSLVRFSPSEHNKAQVTKQDKLQQS